MALKAGQVVRSLAGHDKDRHYLVLWVKDGKAAIADGKRRRVVKPKVKSLKHLEATPEVLELRETLTDPWVRKQLRGYNNISSLL